MEMNQMLFQPGLSMAQRHRSEVLPRAVHPAVTEVRRPAACPVSSRRMGVPPVDY